MDPLGSNPNGYVNGAVASSGDSVATSRQSSTFSQADDASTIHMATPMDENRPLIFQNGHGADVKTLNGGHGAWEKEVVSNGYEQPGNVDTLELWQGATVTQDRTLRHRVPVRAAAFSPNGRVIATGSDGAFALWDTATGKEIVKHRESGGVRGVSFSPDGKLIATAMWTHFKGVKLRDAASAKELAALGEQWSGLSAVWMEHTRHHLGVSAVQFSWDGRLIASNSEHLVKLWDSTTQKMVKELKGSGYIVYGIAFSTDDRQLALARARTVELWDVANGSYQTTLRETGSVHGVAFSPDGRFLAAAAGGETASLRHTGTWEVKALRGDGNGGEVTSVGFSPDSRLLVAGLDDGRIKMWSTATGELVKTLDGHSHVVRRVAFSPDGRLLVSASLDRTVRIWQCDS